MKILILCLLLTGFAMPFSLHSQSSYECPTSGDICVDRNGVLCCANCDGGDAWAVTCNDGTSYLGCGYSAPAGICDGDGGTFSNIGTGPGH